MAPVQSSKCQPEGSDRTSGENSEVECSDGMLCWSCCFIKCLRGLGLVHIVDTQYAIRALFLEMWLKHIKATLLIYPYAISHDTDIIRRDSVGCMSS